MERKQIKDIPIPKEINVGRMYFTNNSLGQVVVLQVKENYCLLLRRETGEIIKAYHCEPKGSNPIQSIVWASGEYYSNDVFDTLNI